MLSDTFKGRLHAVIQMAHERGVDLVCEVNPSANWVSFHFDGVDSCTASMRLDEVMALSTVQLLAKVVHGLGISGGSATPIRSEPPRRFYAGPGVLDVSVFHSHEISMLKLLAWECETGRCDPCGAGDGTRDVAKFLASQSKRL